MKTCPQCNGALNAAVTLNLYNVEISDDGEIVHYDGGPAVESETDVIELVNTSNPTIVCVNGHMIDAPV